MADPKKDDPEHDGPEKDVTPAEDIETAADGKSPEIDPLTPSAEDNAAETGAQAPAGDGPWARRGDDADDSESDEADTRGTDADGFGDDTPVDDTAFRDPDEDRLDDDHLNDDLSDTPLSAEADDSLEAGADRDTPEYERAAPQTPQPAAQPEPRRSGFVPLVIGGVVAAGLGFAASQFGQGALPFLPEPGPTPFEQETEAALAAQSGRLDTLQDSVASLDTALAEIDLQPLSDRVASVEDRLGAVSDAQDALAGRIDALEARVLELEKAPVEDAVSPAAIAAYEQEIEALRASVAESRAEIEAIAETARQSENSAARQAELAESRAALAEIAAALQAGQGYADALATLSDNGVGVPDALSSAASEGIPTPSTLLSEFPDAAREALRVARDLESAEGAADGGLGSFLRSQLGARSVTPRAGDDPDAVLSRAEAALRQGDLDTALSEVATLPEAAQAEMADWVAMAEARRDAVAATGALAQELNE